MIGLPGVARAGAMVMMPPMPGVEVGMGSIPGNPGIEGAGAIVILPPMPGDDVGKCSSCLFNQSKYVDSCKYNLSKNFFRHCTHTQALVLALNPIAR